MKAMKLFTAYLMSVWMLFAYSSCDSIEKQKKYEATKELMDGLYEIQNQLPYKLANTEIMMTAMEVEDSFVAVTVEMTKEYWDENVGAYFTEYSSSDRNYARVISSLDDKIRTILLRSEYGLKYRYLDSDTHKNIHEISISADKFKDIDTKLKNDEIKPMTVLEMFDMELKSYDYPVLLEDGVWITNGCINGSEVCYEVMIEADISPSDVTQEDKREIKSNIIEASRETLLSLNKKDMKRENVKLVYIYKNNSGKEIARITITADDL